jgi:ABC-type nitrate/sulfonate/bicarbonate transport system permease component
MAQAGVIKATFPAERSMDGRVSRIRLMSCIGFVLLWEVIATLGSFGILYTDVVPHIWHIVIAVGYELVSASFYRDLGMTFAAHSVGFICGATMAVLVGIWLGTNKLIREAMLPYLNAIGSTPKIIFLPILFLMFGVGIESKMAKGALSAFFPVVFTTTLGMLLINPVLIRVGRTFNLNKWQMITKIYMPAMVNPVITGFRLGVAITIIGVLVAELKFADGGLGYRLGIYYEQFEIAPMYAVIVLIFAMAAAANSGMTKLQDRVNRHMAPTSSKGKKARASASAGLGVSTH